MSYPFVLNQSAKAGGVEIAQELSFAGSGQIGLDESIPDESTDLEIVVGLDVSAVLGFLMIADQDLTVEPNDGTTPDDAISLVANVPYVWHEDSYDAFHFGTDWTSLFVTNDSGAAARLRVVAVVDATPAA